MMTDLVAQPLLFLGYHIWELDYLTVFELVIYVTGVTFPVHFAQAVLLKPIQAILQ